MDILKILILLTLSFFTFSCEKKSELNHMTKTENILVVDGIITNETKSHKIFLSQLNETLNDSIKYVSGAQVQIFTNDTIYYLNENQNNPGEYYTDTNVSGIVNKSYNLIIVYDNKNYYATDFMYDVLPIPTAQWRYDNNTKLNYFTFICSPYNTNESAIYKLELDWSTVNGYTTLPDNETHAIIYYYQLKTIDLGELLGPQLKKVGFPKGTLVTEKKFSISPAHEEFIRSLLLETNWHGGIFDSAPSNVNSNINKGLGFFGASAVLTNTFIVN